LGLINFDPVYDVKDRLREVPIRNQHVMNLTSHLDCIQSDVLHEAFGTLKKTK
jgi:hypothetical protein